ncbi:MAG: hypothetical protein PHS49_03505 [Candidatus Gracilibacteria bacterium]|nr:hypothetical protein [Candidatus Gracilibacteria bacterium]
MKELHLKAVKAYIEMLSIHIDTKTTDADFHKDSEGYYETLFEVAHKIGEKYVDLGGKLSEITLDEKKKKANAIIENIRKEIENYKENNKVSLGTEDLLGSLANDLENIEGSSKAYIK